MRHCPKCDSDKPLDQFNKDKTTTSGFATWCRECCKAKNKARYNAIRPERLAKQKKWSDANPDKRRKSCAARYERNGDSVRKQALEWAKNNPKRCNANARKHYRKYPEKAADRSALRQSRLQFATPPWVDHEALLIFYREARAKTRETGIKYEVDHIHPIVSDILCGLHVPWNLQILTQFDNRSKGNSLVI